MKARSVVYLLALGMSLSSCSNLRNSIPLEIDLFLGTQFSTQMDQFPMGGGVILDSVKYKSSYDHLNRIKNEVLNSPHIQFKDAMPWRLRIVHNDSVLNAFCIAGGHIYFYTGIIKFLDSDSQLAGVMAHEIAHAERRHTTLRIFKEYGLALAISVLVGTDLGWLSGVFKDLLGLGFSRVDESEADRFAVLYLRSTSYDPAGVAGFFQKMLDSNKDADIPEFVSTHPSPENRIKDIYTMLKSEGIRRMDSYPNNIARLKASLP